jgi:NAD-dependent dihydropyrimidine dehydrogenase PreA subunit
LEEELVAALLFEKGLEVVVVPHLYDLRADGTGMLALQGVSGDMIVLSWLFPRAARWILDRNNIRGQEGVSLLEAGDEEDEDEDEAEVEAKERVIDHRPTPPRKVYCLDLRTHPTAKPYLDEVKRIVAECSTKVVGLTDWIDGAPKPQQMDRFLHPTNDTSLGNGSGGNGAAGKSEKASASAEIAEPIRIQEEPGRRWYPVIDYSRCTNCMECIDFCLFGVYGVDGVETILVEQPDNCRKGCPACSRVCPENAIIFPQHKTPAIAGAPVVAGASLKIDLSQLFGAPDQGKSAAEIAASERDEQLVLAGRAPVGQDSPAPRRSEARKDEPKDELDSLIDQLDALDL